MEYDYSELRGEIKKKYGTESAFADALGMNKSTLSQKLSNKSEFTQQDMKQIINALGCNVALIGFYFFTHKVAKKQF